MLLHFPFLSNASKEDWYTLIIFYGLFTVGRYWDYHFDRLDRKLNRIEAKLNDIPS